MIKGGSKYISLDLLKEIQNNSYRSRCGKVEYSKEEIDDLVMEKETQKMIKQIEKQFKRVV